MNRRTKLVIGSAQLACALVLSGCGAAPDASQSYDAEGEIGSVSEALTTLDDMENFGNGTRLDWSDVTLFVSASSSYNPPPGWVNLDIINNNPGRLHMRTIKFDITCMTTNPRETIGNVSDGYFTFSTYVEPNGGTYHQHMDCASWFGFKYLFRWKMHSESSFGD